MTFLTPGEYYYSSQSVSMSTPLYMRGRVTVMAPVSNSAEVIVTVAGFEAPYNSSASKSYRVYLMLL